MAYVYDGRQETAGINYQYSLYISRRKVVRTDCNKLALLLLQARKEEEDCWIRVVE